MGLLACFAGYLPCFWALRNLIVTLVLAVELIYLIVCLGALRFFLLFDRFVGFVFRLMFCGLLFCVICCYLVLGWS